MASLTGFSTSDRSDAEISKSESLSHVSIISVPSPGSASSAVVPSRREGFGLVCVEAMAAGCPVVAAYPEAQYQLIGNLKSLISIPGDAKALAAAMRSAMKDPVRIKKQAALAKKTADKFFSPKIYFTELNRLYQDLIHA